MYLFTRTATINPEHQLKGMAFVVDIAAKAASITGVPANVYRVSFGAPLGSVLWSSIFESHAALEAAEQKLMADPAYVKATTTSTHLFTGTVDDALATPVTSTLTAPNASYWVTQASIAGGKLTKAIELGSAIQAHIAEATGAPSAFLTDSYGPFGQVRWLTGADSAAELDKVRDTLLVDPTFLGLVEQAGDCFAQGSGHSVLIHRVV